MNKKIVFFSFCVILFANLVLGASVAEEGNPTLHKIVDYKFNVSGSSKTFMLRRFVVPEEGDPLFFNIEAMEKALNQKRAILFNKRVFEEVSYTYELVEEIENEYHYVVTFHIKDSFTFLPLPYPKYDSNYGFRFGLKLYEKNLFGLFGDLTGVVHATQLESSWNDWELNGSLNISNLPVGTSFLSISGKMEAELHDTEFSPKSSQVAIDWADLKLLGSTFSVKGELESSFKYGEIYQHDYDVSWNWDAIPLFGTFLSIDGFYTTKESDGIENNDEFFISAVWRLFTIKGVSTSLLGSYDQDEILSTSLRFSGIPIGRTAFTFEPVVVQKMNEEKWDVTNIKMFTTWEPVFINENSYRLNLNFDKPLEELSFIIDTSLTLINEKVFGQPFSWYILGKTTVDYGIDQLLENRIGSGFSSQWKLPLSTDYSFSYGLSYLFKSEKALNEIVVYTSTQSLKFGKVDWINNFRKGIEGSINITANYADFTEQTDLYQNLSYTAYAEASAFLYFGKRFNISSRINASYAHLPSWAWDELDIKRFPQYMPNETLLPKEQIRGILDASIDGAIGTGEYRKLGAVINIDATFMLLKFKNLGEGFISLFSDVGLFTDSSSQNNDITKEDIKILKTVGAEVYGILDKFRSYPVRASLGLNLDHVIEHFKGNRGFTDIEFVLTVGMGLHY